VAAALERWAGRGGTEAGGTEERTGADGTEKCTEGCGTEERAGADGTEERAEAGGTGDGAGADGTEERAEADGTGECAEADGTPDGTEADGTAGTVLMLPVAELHGHPEALAFWPDSPERAEDIGNVCASVAAEGVRDPLAVCRRPEGGWWVVDGCTRLEAARRAGLEEVPCLAVELRGEQIRDEVFMRNMTRTRFSSGMRVMRYLENNAEMVLAEAERNADPARTGAMRGRKNEGASRDAPDSARVISERRKVSKRDVAAGIELLRCREQGLTVRVATGDRLLVPATDEERAAVEAAYRMVLAGTPLRRWLPAAQGHGATEGRARAAVNYGRLASQALISLDNAFAHWDEVNEATQTAFLAAWRRSMARLPPELMLATRKLLNG